MTDDEVKIAVAEVAGWKRIVDNCGYYWEGHRVPPDYPNSLDAIASAVALLTEEQHTQYRAHLKELTWDFDCSKNYRQYIEATARQRCEALLRTLSRWKD